MQVSEVAGVSPGRMFRAGVSHLLIGLTWSIGPILGFLERADGAGNDLRPEVVAMVVILWPLGIPILLRGLALLQQSFGERGYFRATTEGIELRIGGPSLYARLMSIVPAFRALPANPDTFAIRFPQEGAKADGSGYVYRFTWSRIASFDVTMFTFMIELHSGARLLLRRFYFTEDPVGIARRLNEITQRLRSSAPLSNP